MKRYSRIGLLLLAALVVGCGEFGENSLKFSGTLEITEHALGAPVSGRIASVLVDEGDNIKRGDLLATLERHEEAALDYKRAIELYEKGGTTKQAVEQAALALNDQQIVSPVDGVVLIRVREKGEVVGAGLPIFVVGDRARLWVKVFIPEGIINRVKMDQPATVHFDGLKKSFSAHVSFIAPKAEFTPRNVQTPEERTTQTFAIKVSLDAPDEFLRPGVSADVVLNLSEGK
jgi:multidrug resistance efflux pump